MYAAMSCSSCCRLSSTLLVRASSWYLLRPGTSACVRSIVLSARRRRSRSQAAAPRMTGGQGTDRLRCARQSCSWRRLPALSQGGIEYLACGRAAAFGAIGGPRSPGARAISRQGSRDAVAHGAAGAVKEQAGDGRRTAEYSAKSLPARSLVSWWGLHSSP
jgi:hypothetical protein